MVYPRTSQCVALFHALQSEEYKDSDSQLSARSRASIHRYSIDNGLFCYRTDVAVPFTLLCLIMRISNVRILFEPHDNDLSGHLGRKEAYGSVSQHYWWPKLYKWVSTYVRTTKRASGSNHQHIRLRQSPVYLCPRGVGIPSARILCLVFPTTVMAIRGLWSLSTV